MRALFPDSVRRVVYLLFLTLLINPAYMAIAADKDVAAKQDKGLRVVVIVDPESKATPADKTVLMIMNSQMVRYGLTAINIDAVGIPPENNSSPNLCEFYNTDVALILTIRVTTSDLGGICKATIHLQNSGYDRTGADLGLTLFKQWTMVKKTCAEAIDRVAKEVAYEASRSLLFPGSPLLKPR